MQDNGESFIPPGSSPIVDKAVINEFILIQEANEKLQLENAELKKKIQKEELLHRNLYKQWNEANARLIDKDRELEQLRFKQRPLGKFYRYAFYCLFLIISMLLGFNYNFLFRKNNETGIIDVSSHKKGITSGTASFLVEQGQKLTGDSAGKIPGKKSIDDSIEIKASPSGSQVTARQKNLSKYVVKVKSYFHNKPDINTRRSTFVLPWNDAYGILTALDDVNGFIYVVFTNRDGRTSKGWIRKSDLAPVEN